MNNVSTVYKGRGRPRHSDKFGVVREQQTQDNVVNLPAVYETDEEIENRLNDSFETLELMARSACSGDTRALIVSGAPGLGKSYTVEKVLEEHGKSRVGTCKGYTRPTGIYRLLNEYRHNENVALFDDCDAVFADETSLNLLKAACDSLDNRIISWGAETKMVAEDGTAMEREFDYNGSIIFITNLDFDALIATNNKLTPHLEALMSRSHYINLGMRTKRDYMVRIKQVLKQGMLANRGLTQKAEEDIMDFVNENIDNLRELSLRMVIKASDLYRAYPDKWSKIAASTLFKPRRK